MLLNRLFRYAGPLGALTLALSLGAVGGCKKPEYPACKKDKHCDQEAGETCVDGTCQNCVTDEDCSAKGPDGEDWVCHEFRCADPAEVGGAAAPGEQGAPCSESTECNGGLVCKAGVCDSCAEDMDCVIGSCNLDSGRCEEGMSGGCNSDDECAMDEICDAGMCIFSGDYGDSEEVLCDLQAVYFGFDSPKLNSEVESQLKAAAECIASQGRSLILEAHADPRGTVEYNILLTDKRGQSVRSYLVNLGVPGDSMTVISKGSLEATGQSEDGWAKDRRVEFIWQ